MVLRKVFVAVSFTLNYTHGAPRLLAEKPEPEKKYQALKRRADMTKRTPSHPHRPTDSFPSGPTVPACLRFGVWQATMAIQGQHTEATIRTGSLALPAGALFCILRYFGK